MSQRSFLAFSLILITLGGCGGVLQEMSRDWKNATGQVQPAPPPQPAVYCYNSLGQVSCYEKPQTREMSGAFVGTTATPEQPVDPQKIIPGDTSIPPVGDLPEPALDKLKQENSVPEPAAIAKPTEPASVSEAPVAPVVMPSPPPRPLPPMPVTENSGPPPENKPLIDPYLRELNQQPMAETGADKPVIKPPVVQPIVEPKNKAKKKTKNKAKPKPKPIEPIPLPPKPAE
jgi:hypothetical protein